MRPLVTSPWSRRHTALDGHAAGEREPAWLRAPGGHFAVGITNSAPLPMLSGQRCITDFWRV